MSTDNARAEAERHYPALNADDEALTYPRSAVREHARGGFVKGYEAGWAAALAAGRAETTTEDVYRLAYDVMRHHPGVWYDSLRAAVEALADAGLLATARTESIPHRDELAQAVMEATVPFRGPGGQTAPYVMPVHYAIADAVLALLGGDDK